MCPFFWGFVEVKKGIDHGVKLVVDELKKLALDISDEKQIKAVATISGNNDEEIGNLIATALEKVGRDGVVAIEESKSGETSLEVVEGMQFERGYKSPYFVTDNNTMSAIIEDAHVLIFDGRITTAAELLPVLQKVSAENKSLLIVAEDTGTGACKNLLYAASLKVVKGLQYPAVDVVCVVDVARAINRPSLCDKGSRAKVRRVVKQPKVKGVPAGELAPRLRDVVHHKLFLTALAHRDIDD